MYLENHLLAKFATSTVKQMFSPKSNAEIFYLYTPCTNMEKEVQLPMLNLINLVSDYILMILNDSSSLLRSEDI